MKYKKILVWGIIFLVAVVFVHALEDYRNSDIISCVENDRYLEVTYNDYSIEYIPRGECGQLWYEPYTDGRLSHFCINTSHIDEDTGSYVNSWRIGTVFGNDDRCQEDVEVPEFSLIGIILTVIFSIGIIYAMKKE